MFHPASAPAAPPNNGMSSAITTNGTSISARFATCDTGTRAIRHTTAISTR
jgi:hypothetical protein